MAKSRVLLDVSDAEINIGCKMSWICFCPKETKLISDLKRLIIERFQLSKTNFHLFLNGGVILEDEDIGIFHKGDIIKLQYYGNELSSNETAKFSNSHSLVPPVEDQSYEESGSDNEENEENTRDDSSVSFNAQSKQNNCSGENNAVPKQDALFDTFDNVSDELTNLMKRNSVFESTLSKRIAKDNDYFGLSTQLESLPSTSSAHSQELRNTPLEALIIEPNGMPDMDAATLGDSLICHIDTLSETPTNVVDCIDLTSQSEPSTSTGIRSHQTCGPVVKQMMQRKEGAVYNNLVELNNVALVTNTDTFECPICFGSIAPGEGAVLKECLHMFCKECLRLTIIHANSTLVRCPFVNDVYACQSNLLEREIKSLVSSEVYDSYVQRCMTMAESQASDSYHCKTPDCPGWCFFENDVHTFHCPVCLKYNCIQCAAIHEGQNCREYQDYLERSDADEESRKTRKKLKDMIKNGEAMNCPTCRVVITKRGGCPMMTCTMCRSMFVWTGKQDPLELPLNLQPVNLSWYFPGVRVPINNNFTGTHATQATSMNIRRNTPPVPNIGNMRYQGGPATALFLSSDFRPISNNNVNFETQSRMVDSAINIAQQRLRQTRIQMQRFQQQRARQEASPRMHEIIRPSMPRMPLQQNRQFNMQRMAMPQRMGLHMQRMPMMQTLPRMQQAARQLHQFDLNSSSSLGGPFLEVPDS